jgi:anthranilate synthase/aminodeoxychorismate synthase-like glutamine amidotransferase
MFIGGAHDTVTAPGLILLLDNKDSFVWNLAQALQRLGAEVQVRRSDVDVETPEDAGNSVALIRRWSGAVPVLGVCLGHQAIGHAFGARVVRGEPVHGRPTPVWHDGRGLFAGLPQPLAACRYHSLYVDELPAALVATAHDGGGRVMALRHREHATFGVQFHPESFRTPDGERLLANFLREAA